LVEKKQLAIIVENHPDARPQSGLDKADIVYETLAEGGITRFVPVYYSQEPEVVGPVRSVRKYFLDIIAGLDDPLLMHIGGATSDNPETNALATIQRYGMKSLGISGGHFWRVSDRAQPHDAYVSTVDLWDVAELNGWTGPSTIYTWEFKDAIPDIQNVEIQKIQTNWGGWSENLWSVVWQFDSKNNLYERYHLKDAHVDAVSNEQLTASNVVIIFATQYQSNDDKGRLIFDLIGTGRAKVFRDGKLIEAVWNKPTRTDRFMLKDDSGKNLVFNRGKSWIMIVPVGSEITYE